MKLLCWLLIKIFPDHRFWRFRIEHNMCSRCSKTYLKKGCNIVLDNNSSRIVSHKSRSYKFGKHIDEMKQKKHDYAKGLKK